MKLMRMLGSPKAKLFHDQIITRKKFAPGNKILLYNSKLHIFAGMLKTRWSGPFIVRTVFSHCAVINVDPKNNMEFKVNGQRLKPFLTTAPMTPDDSVPVSYTHLTLPTKRIV